MLGDEGLAQFSISMGRPFGDGPEKRPFAWLPASFAGYPKRRGTAWPLLVFFWIAFQMAPQAFAEGAGAAWLRNGDIVSQSYSIEDTEMQGPVRFSVMLDDGLLATGCWNGLFLFDGRRWSPVPDIPKARSWLRLHDGRMLIGSGGAIYEMRQNSIGAFEHLPVRNVAAIETVIDYMAELPDGRLAALYGKGVMIEQADGTMKSYPLGTWSRGLVSIRAGAFLTVNTDDYHLCRLDTATGRALDIEERFRETLGRRHIVEILPRDGDSCWAITLDGHTYWFDGEKMEPAPWQRGAEPALFVPTSILNLKDGSFVVGSVDEGVYFISGRGEIVRRLNRNMESPRRPSAGLCLDPDEGLWVTTTGAWPSDVKTRFLTFGEKPTSKCRIVRQLPVTGAAFMLPGRRDSRAEP